MEILFDHMAGEYWCRQEEEIIMSVALQLLSIECVDDNEWFGDEPYLNFNGQQVWSGHMGTGDTANLSGIAPIVFNGAANVSLFEEDLGFWPDQNDYLGTFTVTGEQAPGGAFVIDFSGDGHYRLFVDVQTAVFS